MPISVRPFCPDGATGAGADVACTGSLSNASKNSVAEANRLSGSFSSAFMTAARIDAGMGSPEGAVASATGGTVMCCVAHSQGVFALKGRWPASIS